MDRHPNASDVLMSTDKRHAYYDEVVYIQTIEADQVMIHKCRFTGSHTYKGTVYYNYQITDSRSFNDVKD